MKQPALILIDIQDGLDDTGYYGGQRNNPGAEAMASDLLRAWRANHLPVIHVKHNSIHPASPLYPGKAGNRIKAVVEPLQDEKLIEKSANSGFIGTDLQEYLQAHKLQALVIVGLTTDHCVSATTRMAGDLGYEVYLVSDATATYEKTAPDGTLYSAEVMHQTALASLEGEFARVVEAREVLEKFALQ